ncbi:uncharacterized protein LOC128733377 [Sabethes cyaneus]|uniref:uncharacterized protein LOC128733377 n=1 Tax=Sabethes cyaneus TaxID=53552 RepID=UPI00237DE455|nr:uncharacterized protein LOC128733377 [Sabethes cyaneus]
MDTTLEKKCPIIVVNNSNNSTSSSGSEEGNDQNSETSKNTNNTSIVRRNPSILLALDTVHRSLLLKNLQFDQESSYSGGETCSTRGSSTCEEELQQRAIQEHPLDNILAQPRETQVVKVTGAGSDQVDCPKQFTKPVDALETLIKQTTDGTFSRIEGLELVKRQDRDFNNNNNNKNNDSRVMMMVAKYESQRGKAVEGTRVDDTETSDFETASVSSSSLGSLRSSSAFSEGSRDVMSVENFGKPELTNGVTQAECHRVKAGTSTMITINIINKTADNGCDRTSLGTNPQTKAVHVQVPEESETEPTTASSVDDMSSKSEPVEEQQKFDAAEVFSDQSLYDTLQFQTAESQDFLDCGDDVVSSNSGYDESSTEDSDISVQVPKQTQHSKVINQEVIDSDSAPMINIIQEVTPNMQVTSTVILNKAKIKEHRKARAADKKQKQKKEKKKMDNSIFNRQKIIDDNFCNEILDSTIHFDRLYGLNRKTAVETPIEVLSDSAIQPSSAGDESFDSSLSFGKLEGKPRYSGRPVGRLMARRLKKLDKPPKQNKSEGLSDSSASNYANGPKKPPRTFASQSKSRIGWVLEKKESSSGKQSSSEKPSCPKLEDLDSDPDLAGWNFSKKEKSHEMGWTVPKERTNNSAIPPHIYSMLHYSDDETKKRLIKSSKSKAAPQASFSKHQLEQALLGPKLDIDTVDSGCSEAAPVQRKSSSNLEFEAFVANSKIKSTPHKHKQQQVSRRTDLFLKSERKQNFEDRRRTTGNISDREQEFAHFLDNGRRSDHDPNQEIFCRKCTEKSQSKKSFRKAAVRRTKSFFEASKKKIHLQGLKKKAKKDHFETPKKCELGSNLNKENSVKKQLHKHLGYTPDHLRCGSCPKQSGMVHNNLTPEIKSAPARINERHPSNRLPTRTVLNFSGPDMVDSVDGDGAETQKKQKSHEIKFLKTLKNLKISPKKIFKSHDESGKHQCTSTSSPRQYGNFQSYDDLNLDNVAQMGDFLNNVRRAVEVERQTTCRDEAFVREAASISRNRRISTSSELLDSSAMERLRRLRATVDSPPEEPIYQEISPKNNKTIINEFISGESSGNHRYLMVNNNPNVLYATVNKTAKNLIKTKSSNNVCEDQPQPISVKKLNSEPPTSPCPQQSNASIETQSNSATGRRLRRSLFRTPTACDDTVGGGAAPTRSGFADEDNDISVLQEDDDDDHRKDQHLCTDNGNRQRQGVVVDEVVVIRQHVGKMGTSPNERCTTDSAGMRDDDDAYRLFSGDIHRTNSGTMIRQGVATTREEVFEMLRSGTTTVGRAPLGSIDTDDEIESLQKYEDRGLDELRKSLRDNISISEIGTNDTESEAFVTGYDTVDFFGAITPARRNNLEAGSDRRAMDSTIDTDNISELMSAHDYSISNISPVNSSPSSAKVRLNSSDVYRNLKDKLRNSFRKSKNFIKNEQRKIVNYFDEKPVKPEESGNRVVFNLDEYCKKYGDDADAEEIYQSLSNAGSLIELSNQFLAELVNQIKTQTDIRKQLKQALAICRNTREFECSSELIEAERLMLLSTLKENAARNELSKIDYNANGKILNDGKKVGIVALNHFEFPLKETAVNDMLFNYFYVVVCSYKNQVKATLAKERYKDRVYFRNCEIEFHDLDAEYEIRVEVFVLRLRKNARNFSFESKYHLNKESKNFLGSCPSPPKLRSPAKLLSSRSNSPKNFDFDNEFSRFKSQGFITLTSFSLLPGNSTLQMEGNEQLLENCRHSPYYSASSNFQRMVRRQGDHNIYLMEDFKYLKLDSMVYNSNLLGSIGMSVKSEVLFVNSDIDGFINVGQSRTGTVDWSRKWCKLNGFVLEFWNYPQECQEKLPTLQIDLTKCINDGVELADRTSCSRPRTFRLDIFAKGTGSCSSSGISSYKDTDSHQHNRNSDSHHSQQAQQQQQQQSLCDNTKTYLLSVDTPNELKTWLNELNRVVKFLKEWKI